MNDEPKIFVDTKQLLKDPCCPFSRSSLKGFITRAEKNGLSAHIYRVGRKIIINREGFIKWMTSRQNKDKKSLKE
jgi:hypothetical protein